ncbi:MAG: DUF402 domain-containing protein [Anaerolineales bacterium]|nr:DUF402 domain-containing protein [Anaerolineales bacterium]
MKIETICIHKLDHKGQEVLNYTGEVIRRSENSVVLRAIFDLEPVRTGSMTLERGDVFEEYFYTDRWYNIFKITKSNTGKIKGWYCNLTRPAVITASDISAEDLELDLLVYPDKTREILDQREYQKLHLHKSEHLQVEAALLELQRLIENGVPPFNIPE